MKIKACSVHWLWIVTTLVCFTAAGRGEPVNTNGKARQQQEIHTPGFVARITLHNGTTRTANVQGVGCSATMCSRVFIAAKEDSPVITRIWLDSIASIKSVRKDAALFVMKDGSERRITYIPDFRVLYISKPNGQTERLDLGTIDSLEILPPAK